MDCFTAKEALHNVTTEDILSWHGFVHQMFATLITNSVHPMMISQVSYWYAFTCQGIAIALGEVGAKVFASCQ